VIVRAEFPNPEGLLVPGGIVGVGVDTGPPKWALLVPQSAIQLDQAGHFVLVVDGAKKVELRRVTTSVELGRNVVVTDGLKEGELVIVEGIQKVHAGQVVSANVAPRNCRRYYVGRLDCHQVDPDRAVPRHRAAAGDLVSSVMSRHLQQVDCWYRPRNPSKQLTSDA
jgi:hypothetical protein